MHLLTLNISTVWRIKSEKRTVFLGGHPSKYWPPAILCAVCKCMRACSALFDIYYSGPSGKQGTILQWYWNCCNATRTTVSQFVLTTASIREMNDWITNDGGEESVTPCVAGLFFNLSATLSQHFLFHQTWQLGSKTVLIVVLQAFLIWQAGGGQQMLEKNVNN